MLAARMCRRAATSAVAAALVMATGGVARADTGGLGGVPSLDPSSIYGVVASPVGVASMLSSAYGMSALDPVSGAVTGANVSNSLTDAYAIAADLSDSSMLALNVAEMARRAQAEADAKRRAAQAGATKLKAGSIPGPYGPMIEAAVAKYCPSLSPSILAAQIKAESGFNPTARSPVGAMGIAQFMPGTWATSGVDGDGDGVADVWNPADAIPSAAKYDCAVKNEVRSVPGDPVANMLASYNAGSGAVKRYGGIPPFPETANYVRTIMASAASYAGAGPDGASQSAVGPDGCPTIAPSNTLRGGSLSVGLSKVCADSVAGARTPEAALAIKWALANLGQTYSQPKRMVPGYSDCSSFVSRAYDAGGAKILGSWSPTTFTLLAAKYAPHIQLSAAKPGDLVFPSTGHVAMLLADGFMVDTNQTGDVSKVSRAYTSAFATVWINPALI